MLYSNPGPGIVYLGGKRIMPGEAREVDAFDLVPVPEEREEDSAPISDPVPEERSDKPERKRG